MGPEMMTSLALKGINCFNMRFLNGAQISLLALERSGVILTESVIGIREEKNCIARAVEGVEYFDDISYSDISDIHRALFNIRSLITSDNEADELLNALVKGMFTEKNKALLSVYKNYMSLLSSDGVIDRLGLMRLAIRESAPLDVACFSLKEYALSPLESALLGCVSGGKAVSSSCAELFGCSEVKSQVKIADYKRCYGAGTEAESVLADIYRDKKTDSCTIALADPGAYVQLIFDAALAHDIPVTFGTGIPVSNSCPVQLFIAYRRWKAGGRFSGEDLKEMLTGSFVSRGSFNSLFDGVAGFNMHVLLEIAGGCRLTCEKEVNHKKYLDFKEFTEQEERSTDPGNEKAIKAIEKRKAQLPALKILCDELALPEEEFLIKHAKIRAGKGVTATLLSELDVSGLGAVKSLIKEIRDNAGDKFSDEDRIRDFLKKNICVQGSREGYIHVTDTDGAYCCLRDALYITGLWAGSFPGNAREDYLLTDDDLCQFGDKADYLLVDRKVLDRQEKLMGLVRMASRLGNDIHLSYPEIDTATLKEQNASSVLYDIYREETGEEGSFEGFEKQLKEVGYFEPELSSARIAGEAAVRLGNEVTDAKLPDGEACLLGSLLEAEYSPTDINTFFDCPKKFFYQVLLKLPGQDTDDELAVLTPREFGNLAHSLMERLGKECMSREEFGRLADECFESFILVNPPLIPERIKYEKKEFIEALMTGFDTDPGREIYFSEKKLSAVSSCKVKLSGYPDRVEKLGDKCLVVDFKTGSKADQQEDDPDSCLQVLLYAYMLEKNGYEPVGGEYRYLKLGENVSCRFDEEMAAAVDERLGIFKEALDNGEFPRACDADEKAKACKYCGYVGVCKR